MDKQLLSDRLTYGGVYDGILGYIYIYIYIYIYMVTIAVWMNHLKTKSK